jgi:hypothetical protein
MAISDIINNVEIYCGSLFPLTITLTDDNDVPIDLTGFAVYCEIRTQPGGELLATPTVVITPASGQIYIYLTPAQTKTFGAGRAMIDVVMVEIADLTNVRPLLRGDVKVWQQLTRITKTLAGNTHNGTNEIDLAVTTGLVVGMAIAGAGIGSGAVISTIDTDHIHASVVSTADGTGVSLTFSL